MAIGPSYNQDIQVYVNILKGTKLSLVSGRRAFPGEKGYATGKGFCFLVVFFYLFIFILNLQEVLGEQGSIKRTH